MVSPGAWNSPSILRRTSTTKGGVGEIDETRERRFSSIHSPCQRQTLLPLVDTDTRAQFRRYTQFRRYGISVGLTATQLKWLIRWSTDRPIAATETRTHLSLEPRRDETRRDETRRDETGSSCLTEHASASSYPLSTLQPHDERWKPSRFNRSDFLKRASRRLVALLRLSPCHPQDCKPRRKCSNTCTTYSSPFM